MTESKWLSATDPRGMLNFLRSRISERKQRLFACACCRRIWQVLLLDPDACACIERVERFADGAADKSEFDATVDALLDDPNPEDSKGTVEQLTPEEEALPFNESMLRGIGVMAAVRTEETVYRIEDRTLVTDRRTIVKAVKETTTFAAATVRQMVLITASKNTRKALTEAERAERRSQAQLLRDLVGNPFQPVIIPAVVLTWNDGTIPRIAQTIYDERAFERLPILADALEDACCDNPAILDHCRVPDFHARGCWAVDLLLGKT
jgi:hypothetical protein